MYHKYLTYEPSLGAVFLTEQMSLKHSLKLSREPGAEAVVAELRQLDYHSVLLPKHHDLSPQDRHDALHYLMYLKQKRSGWIKARGCTDGRKQRAYKSHDETSSPTVSTEAVFLTSVIDAYEHCYVVAVDIPGVFMHDNMDEVVHMKLEGVIAELLVPVNPEKYCPYMMVEHGKKVVYVQLLKALYGMLQAALLFWQNLSSFLIDTLEFVPNQYDSCVVNKMIDGKQCTIVWCVDDLKISHVDPAVVEDIVSRLHDQYGKEEPISVHRGKVHNYLGMQLDFMQDGKLT